MRLAWVEVRDFRNHPRTHLTDPPRGLIVAVGANGEGKTNLLEAVHYLLTLSSPRVSASLPLVRAGRSEGFLRGEVETLGGKVLVEIEIPSAGAVRVQVNKHRVRRKRDLRKLVRSVFFAPEDVDLIRGDPSGRRRFLDEALVGLWPLRESLLSAYDRALRQRNRLLKEWEGHGAPTGLDAWDEELASAGVAVVLARAEALARVGPAAAARFEGLAGYGLEVTYDANVPPGEDLDRRFRERLSERRADELVRRSSLVGPHRDDVGLAVRELGARAFASHGEASAAALCLRLGLAAAIEEEVGEPPVILVDDPFSALDPGRRERLGNELAETGAQVLISVADEAHVPHVAHATWDVSAGSVTPRR
jgi:DNA replication and repair protein RecF